MAHDSAGYRDHCGECRHFMLDAERSRLRCEVFGEHTAPAHCCDKLHFLVSALDSPSNPSSAAAGCFNYERVGCNGR